MRPGEEIPRWARSCPSGKQKFATADDAWASIRQDSRKRKPAKVLKGTVRVYRCTMCNMFHLTSAARRYDGRKFGTPPKRKE